MEATLAQAQQARDEFRRELEERRAVALQVIRAAHARAHALPQQRTRLQLRDAGAGVVADTLEEQPCLAVPSSLG